MFNQKTDFLLCVLIVRWEMGQLPPMFGFRLSEYDMRQLPGEGLGVIERFLLDILRILLPPAGFGSQHG